MNDVARLVLEAWERLGPGIMGDPEELQRRLARRRSGLLTRPPRAWCLCVRASDRRITPAHWIITPEHAMDVDHPEHPYEPIEHSVTIQPHGLRKFCRAVRTDSWGELVEDVAERLGAARKAGLMNARWAGVFTEKFVKGLGGRRGHPVPLIHSWKTLDPAGAHFQRCDPLWGALWEFLADMVPDDFEQTVVRRPIWKRKCAARRPVDNDLAALHVAGAEPLPPTRSRAAPYPLASPGVPGEGVNIERPTSNVQHPTEECVEDPPEEYRVDLEEMHFWGWSWVCPSCKKNDVAGSITESEAKAMLGLARDLFEYVHAWLVTKHPELMKLAK